MNGRFVDAKLVVVSILASGFFAIAVIDKDYRPSFINMSYVAVGTYLGRQLPSNKR
jgi:hypothetical protein